MRQPYETLLGHLAGHWLLGPHLDRDVPDLDRIMNDDRLDCLSSGEITLLWIALAVRNGDRTARIADLAGLDRPTRLRVLAALAGPNW